MPSFEYHQVKRSFKDSDQSGGMASTVMNLPAKGPFYDQSVKN